MKFLGGFAAPKKPQRTKSAKGAAPVRRAARTKPQA
jgi:hypothetical protein